MSFTSGTKKTKRRFRDWFKSKDSKSTSIRGTDEEQNATRAAPSAGQPNRDGIASRPIHLIQHYDVSASSPAHPNVPTTGINATSSLIMSSGLDIDAKGLSNVEKETDNEPDGECIAVVESMRAPSDIKTGFGIAGRFVQTVLKKLPDCVDGNPVKMALSIVKAIIEIKDEIGDSKDTLTESLQSIRLLLSDAIGKVEMDDSEDVKREIEEYKRKIEEQNTQLVQFTQELESLLRHLDYENYKQRMTKICKTIHEITTMFMLSMQIEIRKTTAKMHEQMKEEKQVRQEEQKERRTMSLQDLNPARKADHRTVLEGQALKRETCTEGTRTKILEDITKWANDRAENSPHVFWLTGQAGSGKTTIAYTIAKLFEKGQAAVLGANFLCSRQFDETRSLNRIIPTIAYQLSRKCGPYEAALHAHVQDKSSMVDRDITEQIQELLVKPWKDADFPEDPATHLTVIDALDELNEDGGSRFLSVLLTTIDRHDLRNLKFLVTSRTDPHIVKLCNTFKSKAVCRLQDVPIEEAEADVERYLDTKLPKLVGSPELAELSRRASGLFIYAATVFRILTTSRSITHKEQTRRLGNILSKPSSISTVGRDKSPIDGLYEQILYDAFSGFVDEEDLTPRLRILYTYICAAERISPSVASTLMDDDGKLATSVLNDLHAVLYVQDGRVFWYHSSFPDFLMEQTRSNFLIGNAEFSFWCNEAVHHFLLALSCFRIMSSSTHGLKFNIGGISSSYLLDSECMDEISTNLNKNIHPALQYSSLHWGRHLSSSAPLGQDIDHLGICITEFLQIRVLFWIEAMNLLEANSRCILCLHQARQWVMNTGFAPSTQKVLEHDLVESANFATYFGSSPAAESTPHLYISSLATWNSVSSLSNNWKNQFSSIDMFTYGKAGYDVPLLTVDLREYVYTVAFSHDGTRIVAAFGNGSLQIMDASTGKMLKILTGHTGWVRSACFSHDGKWIASASDDCTARMWDSSTGKCLKVLTGHDHWVNTVTISQNDLWIASGSEDKSIRLWNALTGHIVTTIRGHTNTVTSVSFSMDGARIASGSLDCSVRVWDVSNGQELTAIRGHTGRVNSVAYTIDGASIVSASYDMSVRVWDAATGEQRAALLGHSGVVWSVAVSSPGYVVTGSSDQSVRIWDINTGHTLKVMKGHNESVNSVVFSNDPIRIASGSGDGFVRVWNLRDVLEKANFDDVGDDTSPVTSVGFSRDDTQIIFGTLNGSVHIWDLSTNQELRVLKDCTNPVITVAFSDDKSRFAWASWNGLWVWKASKNAAVKVPDFGDNDIIRSVVFLKDGRLLVLASNEHIVRLWDESTGVKSLIASGPVDRHQRILSLGISQDGQHIVSGSHGSLRVWEVSSGDNLNVLKRHGDFINSVVFSHDASRIAYGSSNYPIYPIAVWDASTGAELNVLRGHRSWVESVAFTSNNAHIVSGSNDSTVRIWDVHTGKEVYNLRGRHTSGVNSIAISNDNKSVISGAKDGFVIIWDLEDPPWYLADTNWIHSVPTNARLMWVPPEAHVLRRPNCRILVGKSLYSIFDYERAMLAIGPTWEKCYTPNIHSAP